MTARFDTSPHSPEAPEQQASAAGVTAAIAVSGLGALLTGLAPLLGIVTPPTAPAFLSWPLLFGLAAAPPVLAALLLRARPRVAAAVLLGPAVLAPGRIVTDAQFIPDAGLAARPELVLPVSIDQLSPSLGLWSLLLGHLAAGVAGVLAMRRGEQSPDPAFGDGAAGVRRPGLLISVLAAAVAVALGLLLVPFDSTDPFLLPRAALDAPPLAGFGRLLVAIAVLGAAGYAAVSTEPDTARGGLLGLSPAVMGVVVPPLIAGFAVNGLHCTWATVVASIAAALLLALAVPAGRTADGAVSAEPQLPTLDRTRTIAAVLAVVSGVLALLGAMLPHLNMPADLRDPTEYPARMLWPSGLTLVLLGGAVFSPLATRIRPALTVAWLVMPLAGTAVLDAVLTTTEAVEAPIGIGAWATVAAVLVAPLAAAAAALVGAMERDDVDLTEVASIRGVAVAGGIAALLGVGAFSLPVVTADGYAPPGLFTDFETASWGLLGGLLGVGLAAALAPRSRPTRATALLGGAALLPLVRALEFPLTVARTNGSPGLGLWFALACVAALLAALVVAIRSTPPDATLVADSSKN